ncbi:MAG: HNH endonuclease signature motif containing protein [Candidatus Woesearchaeota archaeon]
MYFCEFCDYKTLNRNNIEYHHIIPKELNGVDNSYNRVYLCPNHHKMIYVDGSLNGIHSIKNSDSIIIKGQFNSTEGKLLLIEDSQGIEKYIVMKNLYS